MNGDDGAYNTLHAIKNIATRQKTASSLTKRDVQDEIEDELIEFPILLTQRSDVTSNVVFAVHYLAGDPLACLSSRELRLERVNTAPITDSRAYVTAQS